MCKPMANCKIYKNKHKTPYLLGGVRILGNSPSVTEAVGQLKDSQHEFSLGGAALL